MERNDFMHTITPGNVFTSLDRAFAVRYAQGVDGVCVTNLPPWRSIGRMGHVEEIKQRAFTGAIWGQEPGPKIKLL